MSVLIKNATMPKCCDDCNLESYCNLWTRCRNEEKRHPDCPLVEVQSHGRLIDADALMEQIMIITKDRWVYNTISHAPTIIRAEDGDE